MVRIVAGEERPATVKQAFFKAVVATIGSRSDVAAEHVVVVLDTVSRTDLSVAGGCPSATPLTPGRRLTGCPEFHWWPAVRARARP